MDCNSTLRQCFESIEVHVDLETQSNADEASCAIVQIYTGFVGGSGAREQSLRHLRPHLETEVQHIAFVRLHVRSRSLDPALYRSAALPLDVCR